MTPEYLDSEIMKWAKVSPPAYWKEANALIVGDRHLPNGIRQHMVLGSVKSGLVIDNAQVIGQDDVPEAEFYGPNELEYSPGWYSGRF
jgi:hypothetical protein